MSGKIWRPTITRHTRYCKSDKAISQYILQYSSLRQKNSLKILDVGCSTGSAARHMAGYLRTLGIDCTVDGLDRSEIVKSEADKNLNKFYQCDLFDAVIEPVYDVVICSRLLRFFEPPDWCKGAHKCASFCNDNGVVITDGIPNVSSATGGYAMLSPAAIHNKTAYHMEDCNGIHPSGKLLTYQLKFLVYRCLGSPYIGGLDCLNVLIDRLRRTRCQYCNPPK